MIAKAIGKHIRVTPRKMRQVIDLIRGKRVSDSVAILTYTDKRCTVVINKLLNSAVHNAKQKGLMEDQLFISRIIAEEGPAWKRYRSSAFGRALGIKKRTSHLTIELDLVTK